MVSGDIANIPVVMAQENTMIVFELKPTLLMLQSYGTYNGVDKMMMIP